MAERKRDLAAIRRKKRWRQLFGSLVVVQILVLLMALFGEPLLNLLGGDRIQWRFSFRVLLFIGMAVGTAITILLVVFSFGLSAAHAVAAGSAKRGWPVRVIRRVIFAGIALSLTSVMLCGTVFLFMTQEEKDGLIDDVIDIGDDIKKNVLPEKKEKE